MSKQTSGLNQIFRADSRGAFFEITTDGFPIDRIVVGMNSYNIQAAQGSRITGSVRFYIPVHAAARFAQDILSGRCHALAKKAREKATADGQKFVASVFTIPGGSAKGDVVTARTLELVPGNQAPWILTGKQGAGHTTQQGLIVMDGQPQTVVRVSMNDDTLKEFALALRGAYDLWMQAKFLPQVRDSMAAAAAERQNQINQYRNNQQG